MMLVSSVRLVPTLRRMVACGAFVGAALVGAAQAQTEPLPPAAATGKGAPAGAKSTPPAAAVKQPVTITIKQPPAAPLECRVLITRTDAADKFDPLEIPEKAVAREKGGLLGGDACRFVVSLLPGAYTITVKLPGYPDLTKPNVVVKKDPVDFSLDAKIDKPAELTITVPPAAAGEPLIQRAKGVWEEGKGWRASGEFEAADLGLKLKKTGASYSTSLLPWRYRITVRGADPTPFVKELDVAPGASALTVNPDDLERRSTFEFSVSPPRSDLRYVLRGAGPPIEVQPNVPQKLETAGQFELQVNEGGRSYPVWRGEIPRGVPIRLPLDSSTFGKGAFYFNTDFTPQNVMLFDRNNQRVAAARQPRPADPRRVAYWIDANRDVFAVIEHAGQSSAQLGPIQVNYLEEKSVPAPSREEFETGQLKVEVRNARGIPAVKLIFTATGATVSPPQDRDVVTATYSTVSLPPGTYNVRARLEIDGERRELPVGSDIKVPSAARRESPPSLSFDLGQFMVGKLSVRAVGNLPSDLRLAGQLESGGPRETFELNGEKTVPLGRWRITATSGDKTIPQSVDVRFGTPAKLEFKEEYFFNGAVSVFTSSNPAGNIVLRPASGGSEVTVRNFEEIKGTALLSGLRRADIGHVEGGLVSGGLREGLWTVEGLGQPQKILIRGARHQAIAVFNDAKTRQEFEDEPSRGGLVMVEPAKDGDTAIATTPTPPTKKDDTTTTTGGGTESTKSVLDVKFTGGADAKNGKTGPSDSGAPKGDQGSKQAGNAKNTAKRWVPGESMPVKIGDVTIQMIWHRGLDGWMAATTVPGENGLPRSLTFRESEELVARLNATYKEERDNFKFVIPTVEQWRTVAGNRQDHAARDLVFARSAPEAVTATGRNEFFHLYGNVWQWVQPEVDGQSSKFRVVGGSFLTKPEQMPESGVSYLRSDKARDNVGLRVALVRAP